MSSLKKSKKNIRRRRKYVSKVKKIFGGTLTPITSHRPQKSQTPNKRINRPRSPGGSVAKGNVMYSLDHGQAHVKIGNYIGSYVNWLG
jgi:hypothetical protein